MNDQEIRKIVDSESRSDWMEIAHMRLADNIAAQIRLLGEWPGLDNKKRAIILERASSELINICIMVRGRSVFANDDQNGSIKDDYLILATQLEMATPEVLEAVLVEIAKNRENGQWHLSKLAEAMDRAKKKIEAGKATTGPENEPGQ